VTVTPDQARMLTTLAIACRPTGARRWDSAGVMAAIKAVSDRSLAGVVMAVIRAASDRDVETPGVIPTPGSHWAESALMRVHTVEDPAATRCTICGRTQLRHGEDHGFAMPGPKPSPEEVAERVAALKAELAPTSGPTARRTLEDLAEANPELHARVEAVRAANPGLQAPPLQEPLRDPTPDQPDTEPDEPQEAVQ
jgi:hypothetical protein